MRKALLSPPKKHRRDVTPKKKKILHKLVANDLMNRVSYEEYRDKVRDVYGGPQGAFLALSSLVSGHSTLGDKMLRERKFDLRGLKHILDIGSGAGQIVRHLLKYADPEAMITGCDLAPEMLERARTRLKSSVPRFVAADLARLPFADASFDGVTCGYVLEHLPEAKPGLAEMARVMKTGGRLLLLATEDSFSGVFTSRFWCCRTYNRQELFRTCHEVGLEVNQELWFTRMHKLLRAGGICVELVKR